ncbi:Uma2 family endonuclease [Bacillus piscicola]|uniref:Uma2 family endonuclease n=1 Tax=Bacillus piscicola TaxID=1632684 RepID=UPI001F08D264|nr:Uma2 family endonuclease [Bacillus piscicola]
MYEEARVKEHWIVDPAYEIVDVFVLVDESFHRKDVFTKQDRVSVSGFGDFAINLSQVFEST